MNDMSVYFVWGLVVHMGACISYDASGYGTNRGLPHGVAGLGHQARISYGELAAHKVCMYFV